ncbi:hypothetical protein V8E36_008973 [Tilletia maclaganii]
MTSRTQLGRVYRTVDLTRHLWSGEIEFLGREDDSVKSHGVRIRLLGGNESGKKETTQTDGDAAAIADALRAAALLRLPSNMILALLHPLPLECGTSTIRPHKYEKSDATS